MGHAVRRRFWYLIAAWCLGGTFLFNPGFLRVQPASLPAAIAALPEDKPADVVEIYRGYVASGTPFAAAWWTGPWIHTNPKVHQSYRPLSSVLLWWETDLALRHGFRANGWVGVLLWAVASFMAALFCWRLTRDPWCVLGLVLLLPLFHIFEKASPAELLWWYPFHPELLFAALAFGVLIALDAYFETRRSVLLLPGFLCFACALALKESAVIVPLFCLVLYGYRYLRRESPRSRTRENLTILGGFAAVSILFLVYRQHILTHPYGPHVREISQVFHGMNDYLSASWASELNAQFWWIPALCVLIVVEGVGFLRLRREERWRHGWRRYSVFAGVFLLPMLFLWLATGQVISSILILFVTSSEIWHELTMLVDSALLFVAVPRWRRDPALLSFALLFLSTVPVWCFPGWHYMVVPWFFRAIMYACFTRLALEQWAGYRISGTGSICHATKGL